MSLIPANSGKGEVKSKLISSGETIGTNPNYVELVDMTLAGKQFQGVAIYGVASKKVYYTTACITDTRFQLMLINASGASQTTGDIYVYYKD